MLTEPGLNTLQRKEVDELIQTATATLREEIAELGRKVESLEERGSWYVIKDSESWRF